MKTHKARTFLGAGVLLAVAVIEGNLAQAQTGSVTWTGNARNGSWSTAGNWNPRKVPGPTSNVCIPIFTTANGGGLDGSASSISVHSIQVAEGGGHLRTARVDVVKQKLTSDQDSRKTLTPSKGAITWTLVAINCAAPPQTISKIDPTVYTFPLDVTPLRTHSPRRGPRSRGFGRCAAEAKARGFHARIQRTHSSVTRLT